MVQGYPKSGFGWPVTASLILTMEGWQWILGSSLGSSLGMGRENKHRGV